MLQRLGWERRKSVLEPSRERVLIERWGLSPRQAKVACALATGQTYKEIAADLGITFHTVNTHVKAVLEKTGARTSRKLAVMVHELGPGVVSSLILGIVAKEDRS